MDTIEYGSDIKIKVELTVGEYTMDQYDFTCKFKSDAQSIVIPKAAMTRLSSTAYMATIRAKQCKLKGEIFCEARIKVPDQDFLADAEDWSVRNEVITFSTDIIVE